MSAPIILPSGSAVAGVTLQKSRRGLADEVGRLAILTTTSTPSTATTPRANRQILATEMQADGQLPDALDGCWVYVVDGAVAAGEVRRILSGSYEGAIASMLVDRPFSSPLASGTTIEITDTLPAKRYGMWLGFRECINEGLERLPVPDRVAISITDSQVHYPLTDLSWPVKSIEAVYEPRAAADDRLIPTLPGAYLDLDAELPQLVLGSSFTTSTADEFLVALRRPANTWIRSGGSWGDSTTGLVNESDAALYDVRTLVMMAAPIALMHLGQQFPVGSPERADRLGEAETRRTAAALGRWYGAFGSGPRVQRVGATGGRRGSWWRNH